MLIEWTKKNLHHIAFRPSLAEGEAYNMHNVKTIDLIFGVNQVDDALWNDCKKQLKTVSVMLKSRLIKELGSEDLSKRDEGKAVEIVKNCFAINVLKSWKRDPRQVVADAAQGQLDEINDALHGGKKQKQEQAEA